MKSLQVRSAPGFVTATARALLPLSICWFGLALSDTSAAADAPMVGHDHGAMDQSFAEPLVDKVRSATRRFLDIKVAISEGWVQATPCVSGPNEGAMGVHFVKPERVHDGVLNADQPEMLIYEPRAGHRFRLVGVEYIVIASEFAAKNAPGVAPSIDGHLANFVGEPNRYALPAFYEMHVWAWQDNPHGEFSDFNPLVSCSKQPS